MTLICFTRWVECLCSLVQEHNTCRPYWMKSNWGNASPLKQHYFTTLFLFLLTAHL